MLQLDKALAAELANDGLDRLMIVKRLRAKALTADGPERIDTRKQIQAALTVVLGDVRVYAGKQVNVALRFGGNIGILDGKALPVLNDPRLRAIALDLIKEHHPEQVAAAEAAEAVKRTIRPTG